MAAQKKADGYGRMDLTNAVPLPRWLRNEMTTIRCPTALSLPSSESVLDKNHGATGWDGQVITMKASTETATYSCVGIPASYPRC
jgi:hypothetical protein